MNKRVSPSKKVTSHDVARRAGVSQAAVSLAFNGSNRVSEKRTAEIKKIAAEMGYFPSAVGQMLRNRQTGFLGLIMAAKDPDMAVSSGFMGPLMARFVRYCSDHDKSYIIDFHHHAASGYPMPKQVASELVDGAVVVGDVGAKVTQALGEKPDFPWVSVGEPGDYCVLNDTKSAIDLAVIQLAELGHRRIAYAGGPDIYCEHIESRDLFQRAMRTRQLRWPDGWVAQLDRHPDQQEPWQVAYDWAARVLGEKLRPTAILCRGERLARVVAFAAAELGIKIPADLSIISWGGDKDARLSYPVLTTLAPDFDRIVSSAIEIVSKRIDRKPLDPITVRVPMRLVPGNTVAKA